MITKEMLQDFFNQTRKLRDEKKVRFDIDAVCRWSYFFVDRDEAKLAKLGRSLERDGYENVGFLEPSPDNDKGETIFLRADRIERHTVESLHAKNLELYELAERFGVESYDGMDVGAVDGP